jgi:hypothetical protein
MAVPSSNNHLVNTVGGSFTATVQGGTILGNGTSSGPVANALLLLDAVDGLASGMGPKEVANGLSANTKSYSSGTFAYFADGQYVIRTISATLSGVANTTILIPGSDVNSRRPIHQFEHSFGAKTVTKFRAGQFTLTGTLASGASNVSRLMWLNSGGTAAAAPAALNENMYDIADGDATDRAADSAASPTRAIPGEFVMKADFVDLSVSTGGDFFDYKPITGK